jgi:hypothetical protein
LKYQKPQQAGSLVAVKAACTVYAANHSCMQCEAYHSCMQSALTALGTCACSLLTDNESEGTASGLTTSTAVILPAVCVRKLSSDRSLLLAVHNAHCTIELVHLLPCPHPCFTGQSRRRCHCRRRSSSSYNRTAITYGTAQLAAPHLQCTPGSHPLTGRCCWPCSPCRTTCG